jgi:hypothetical protein
MKRKFVLLGLILGLLFASCSRSVEGETSSWTRNTQKIADLKALYPGMRAALDEKLREATSAWDAAQSVSGEDEKIKAMAKANGLISGGFISDLDNFSDKEEKLNKLILDVQAKAKGMENLSAANAARSQAQMALQDAKNRIQMGVGSSSEANTVMRKISSDLDAATKNLKSILDGFAQEKKETENAKKAEEEKAQPWNCNYCGKSNTADALECGGCGAHK